MNSGLTDFGHDRKQRALACRFVVVSEEGSRNSSAGFERLDQVASNTGPRVVNPAINLTATFSSESAHQMHPGSAC